MTDISFPYKVTVNPEPQGRGLDRWVWLSKNVGAYTVDWNMIVAFEAGQPVIYLFKRQDDAVRFALTWL
jgi:hypothetical protein